MFLNNKWYPFYSLLLETIKPYTLTQFNSLEATKTIDDTPALSQEHIYDQYIL